MIEVTKLLVHPTNTLREALLVLNATGGGIALLVDADGRLVRTVTDGDLRRLLLAGTTLDTLLSTIPPLKSKAIDESVSRVMALDIMNEHGINQLPVVDKQGRPVRMLLRRDVDTPILLSTPHMGEFEREYIEDAFRSNWVAPLGPNVDAFERELAAYVGIEHAAALVSGTAAIHLALRLIGVQRGDTVFCSSLTFVASANPILYEGATPVFIDSEPTTWNMSPQALERALEDAKRRNAVPRAVIVVNLYGQSADLDPIIALCDHYGVNLIEDAAESLGATYKGKRSGTLGRISVFSFNGNKIITTSGGGMLVAHEEELVKKARFLATQARDPAPYYEHTEVGYNYRMSNVLAGIGRGQLKVLEDRVSARRAVFDRYVAGLSGYSAIEWMPEAAYGRSTRWLSTCTLSGSISPANLIEKLAAQQIEARRVWKPMHLQPLFAKAQYFRHTDQVDVAGDIFLRGICLPSGSNMDTDQQDRIVDTIKRILQTTA
jgi:dTDP-4-amino-4,6-dideoxygalactose transaminase